MRRDLLDAVLAAPLADEPRLVLADWLMEQGDPRGDFIASQCLLAGGLSRPRRAELVAHVEELLEERGAGWYAPAVPLAVKKLSYKERRVYGDKPWRFRRGFLDFLIADGKALIDGGQALWDVEPVIKLDVRNVNRDIAVALAAQPFLARMKDLTLRGSLGDRGVAALAESPHLGQIERLNLCSAGITDRGATSLAGARSLSSCRMLALSGNAIGDEGAAALAASPVLAGVERLYLARNALGDEGVAALAASPHVGQLRELGLGTLEALTDQGAQALLDSSTLVSLGRLEVDVCYGLSRKMLGALRERFASVHPVS